MAPPLTLTLTLPSLDRGQAAALFDLCSALQEAIWTTYEPDLLDEAVARSAATAARRDPARPVATLSGKEACALVHTLEAAVRALWRAHGDAIADYLACVDPQAMEDYAALDDVSVVSVPNPEPVLDF
jgi:hypothetical protein